MKIRDEAQLDAFRQQIDEIDSELVRIIGRRAGLVRKLMKLKGDSEAVRSPGRVEQVVRNAESTARLVGAPVEVVTPTYRAMIQALTDLQLREYGGDATPATEVDDDQ